MTHNQAERLMGDIAAKYNLSVREIKGNSRHRHLLVARREIAETLRDSGWSTTRIGKLIGGRHHTTVINWLHSPSGRKTKAPECVWLERVETAIGVLRGILAEAAAYGVFIPGHQSPASNSNGNYIHDYPARF